MSVTYHNLVRRVAYNTKALRGERTQEVATSYIAPLTAAELTEIGPPLQALYDSVLLAEEEFVMAIASTGNHPWRTVLRGFTANLADKAVIPAVDSAGKSIISSVYGAVRDATDSTLLWEAPLSLIDRRVRNSNGHYRVSVYLYKIDGSIIRHTRNNVTIEVCSYDRAAQATAIAANSAMLLPDALEMAIVDRATCLLDRSHKPMYSDEVLAAIKAGNNSVVPRSAPLPVTLERAG